MASAAEGEDTSFAKLQQLLAQRRSQGGKSSRAAADSTGKPVLSTQDVVSLLDRVAHPAGCVIGVFQVATGRTHLLQRGHQLRPFFSCNRAILGACLRRQQNGNCTQDY